MTPAEGVQETPRCPHFGTCGGCQSQHVPYAQQVTNKHARLVSLLGSHYTGEITVHTHEAYGYRNRMDYVFAPPRTIGFRSTDARGLVPVTVCPISDERIARAANELRAWLDANPALAIYDARRKSGVLKYAVVRTATRTGVTIIIMVNEDAGSTLTANLEAIKAFGATTTAENLVVAYTPADTDTSLSTEYFVVKGSEYCVEDFCGVPVEYHALAFFQNNPRVAERMVAYVKDVLIARGIASRAVVDAYGGVGTFGVVLAPHCAEVISIESHPLSSACCTRNAAALGLANLRAITDDAANLAKHSLPKGAAYLVDPPRSGMTEKAIRALLATNTDTIVYVSCNPAALAKELVLLGRNYRVAQVALFDMFPQTNHVECVAVLERKTA